VEVFERLRNFLSRGLLRINDCKKSALFRPSHGEERSESDNFAFGVKSHTRRFDAEFVERVAGGSALN
jgi:hypothetical protein